MSSVAFTIPEQKINLGQLLKVVGLPTERERSGSFSGHASDLIREVISVIDGLVDASIDQKTSLEFVRTREEIFPQYVAAVTALGSLAKIVLPNQAIERLSVESFSQMEADFRDLGDSAFGSDLKERGIFTVWTLRKIYDLAKEIEIVELPKEHAIEDAEKTRDFVRHALWNKFHVDVLMKAMRSEKPIYPEVKEDVREGLRAAVNAYAHIRQWADIRKPVSEPQIAEISWSDEDEMLLADSMRDLDVETT